MCLAAGLRPRPAEGPRVPSYAATNTTQQGCYPAHKDAATSFAAAAHYWQIRRHPRNRKYKTYRHAAVLEEDRAAAMANMHENVATFGCVILEIRQRTNTQTHRHTPSSQYSAPRRKHGLACCAFSINFLNRRSRIHYLDI